MFKTIFIHIFNSRLKLIIFIELKTQEKRDNFVVYNKYIFSSITYIMYAYKHTYRMLCINSGKVKGWECIGERPPKRSAKQGHAHQHVAGGREIRNTSDVTTINR